MKYEVQHAQISLEGKSFEAGEVVDAVDLGEYVAWFESCGAVKFLPKPMEASEVEKTGPKPADKPKKGV